MAVNAVVWWTPGSIITKAAAALCCIAVSPAIGAHGYRFKSIDFPGAVETQVFGINSRGDIVGMFLDANGVTHNFLRHKGEFIAIAVPGAPETLAARGINSRGDIAGNFFNGVEVRGYVLSDGRFQRINFPGALATALDRINAAGDVMGFYVDKEGNGRGFIRRDGKFQTVDLDIPDSGNLVVRGAQDNGKVLVGRVVIGDGVHGFVRGKTGEFELFDYPGQLLACNGVRAINQRGDLVGSVAFVGSFDECLDVTRAAVHGFLFRDGKHRLIDFPGAVSTDAMCINDDRVIVGTYTAKNGSIHGFVATPKD
jgi:hypothetical protein